MFPWPVALYGAGVARGQVELSIGWRGKIRDPRSGPCPARLLDPADSSTPCHQKRSYAHEETLRRRLGRISNVLRDEPVERLQFLHERSAERLNFLYHQDFPSDGDPNLAGLKTSRQFSSCRERSPVSLFSACIKFSASSLATPSFLGEYPPVKIVESLGTGKKVNLLCRSRQ